jgi:hypothetical protein
VSTECNFEFLICHPQVRSTHAFVSAPLLSLFFGDRVWILFG